MPNHDQVLRFAVGAPDGPRSGTWRLWVPRGKSDVYVSRRRVANSVKVSLHEPGPARFALTTEFLRAGTYQAPEGRDPRLATEWEWPRPQPPSRIARPLTIMVPWDEVREREVHEPGEVVWTPPPPKDSCVHFDIVYVPAGARVPGHPGARSMGTELVGTVELENGHQVFVTSLVRAMEPSQRTHVDRLRSAPFRDDDGNVVQKTGIVAFAVEANPDADDGTSVGSLIDVTRNADQEQKE